MNDNNTSEPHDVKTPSDEHHTRYEKYKAEKELAQAIGDTQEILIRVKTVFPFTLFPDTIIIDRNKLTVTHRTFFMVGEVMSIHIEDILNVTANVGPFFGSLRITTRFFDPVKPYRLNWLWRNDALKIKRILQGSVIAAQKKIDCSALTTKELVAKFNELGQAAPDEQV